MVNLNIGSLITFVWPRTFTIVPV